MEHEISTIQLNERELEIRAIALMMRVKILLASFYALFLVLNLVF